MKPTCEELELHLEESQREFRAADATIHNLELKLTDMAVQLANAESKCRELEARTITLPEALNSYAGVKIYRPNDVIEAIRAAGIGVKGE